MYVDELVEGQTIESLTAKIEFEGWTDDPIPRMKCRVLKATSGWHNEGDLALLLPTDLGIKDREKEELYRTVVKPRKESALSVITPLIGNSHVTLVFKDESGIEDKSLYLLADRKGSELSLILIDSEDGTKYEMDLEADIQQALSRVVQVAIEGNSSRLRELVAFEGTRRV